MFGNHGAEKCGIRLGSMLRNRGSAFRNHVMAQWRLVWEPRRVAVESCLETMPKNGEDVFGNHSAQLQRHLGTVQCSGGDAFGNCAMHCWRSVQGVCRAAVKTRLGKVLCSGRDMLRNRIPQCWKCVHEACRRAVDYIFRNRAAEHWRDKWEPRLEQWRLG